MRLNSNEIVNMAIRHQETDRVPLSIAGLNSTIDKKLKQYLNLRPDDNEGLLKALNIDTRKIHFPPYTGKRLFEERPGQSIDPLWGIRSKWVENPSGGYWDYCDFPLRNASEEEIADWPMPDGPRPPSVLWKHALIEWLGHVRLTPAGLMLRHDNGLVFG